MADGTIYGLSVKDGSAPWSVKAPAGVNSFPVVTKNMLVVVAGLVSGKQKGQIIAYSLNGQ